MSDFILKMVKFLAKYLLIIFIFGFIFTGVYLGIYYMRGNQICRSVVSNITQIISEEGCLSKDEIYRDEDGNLVSMYDRIKNYVEDTINRNWFLETNPNFFGGKDDNCSLRVYYTDSHGNVIVPDNYAKSAPKATKVHIELIVKFRFVLRLVPNTHSDPGNGVWDDNGYFTLNIYKSFDDIALTQKTYKGSTESITY